MFLKLKLKLKLKLTLYWVSLIVIKVLIIKNILALRNVENNIVNAFIKIAR
jgi:hypothetical protein